jgi:ditrans,polycis-polyprenyl diphosphate synthase
MSGAHRRFSPDPPILTIGSNISVSSIDDQLDTSLLDLPPVDILIRSSGVHRFSDFLLWQVSPMASTKTDLTVAQISENTEVSFVPTYWPKFGLLDMIPIILDYQRHQWKS